MSKTAILERLAAVLATLWCVLPSAAHGQVRLGSEFRVNTYTTRLQVNPAVASTNGDFVVVWTGASDAGVDNFGIVGQRYQLLAEHLRTGFG